MLDSNDNGRSAFKSLPQVLSAMLRASDGILDLLPIATFICDARGTIPVSYTHLTLPTNREV